MRFKRDRALITCTPWQPSSGSRPEIQRVSQQLKQGWPLPINTYLKCEKQRRAERRVHIRLREMKSATLSVVLARLRVFVVVLRTKH